MYFENDLGQPCVHISSVQYLPANVYFTTQPHDILLKVERDPKGREGVFVQPFSRDGIIPMAHVSHKVKTALKFGWPELSHNDYFAIIPYQCDKNGLTGYLRSGFENLMEFPILMGILELEGMVENAEQDALYGSLAIDEKTNKIKVEVPEDIDIEFRYWLRNNGTRPVSAKEMPTVPVGRDTNRISNEAAAILSEKTPERFMRSLFDSKILRDGASAADISALKSCLDSLLGHTAAGTKSLKKSLDMRERANRH